MELRAAATDLAALHRQLLTRAPDEGAAFIAAEPGGRALLLRSYRVFGERELDPASAELSVTDEAQTAELATLKRGGHALVEVHTHPGSGPAVTFSRFDEEQLPPFARYVQLKLPGRPFGALVLSEQAYAGRVWTDAGVEPLTIRPVGQRTAVPDWADPGGTDPISQANRRFDRQIRSLGPNGQARIQALRVGVVGLGGTGSQVVHQLAHLGVRRYVLVEDDVVETSNLARLAGATRWDPLLRRRKVAVARRTIRRLSPTATVRCPGSLRRRAALTALADVDVIVGCVDNDGARLVMSELAAAYLVPYLDIGVGIEDQGPARSLGGRVSFYLPGGPCLVCADEIDLDEVAEDLESEALRNIRVQRGYARDRRVEPALMPLNGVVASLGMMEFLAFATGLRPVISFTRYDAMEDRLVRQWAEANADCAVCRSAHGMGDRQMIDRYALDPRT
jgi:molybdopterin/thiamine biosynthesis adenylyltransferase